MENINLNKLWYADIKSLALVLQDYADNFSPNQCDDLDKAIWFNTNTWIAYIALDNWIQIISSFGNSVQYLVTNYDNWDESIFDSYSEALANI